MNFSSLILTGIGVLLLAVSLAGHTAFNQHLIDLPRLLILWLFPMVGVSALVAAFKAPDKLRTNLALALTISGICAVLGLYALQGALYLVEQSARAEMAAKAGATVDHRTKIQVIADLREAGKTAYPFVYPRSTLVPDTAGVRHSRFQLNGAEIMPLAGIADVWTVYGNPPYYLSDDHGYHNPPGRFNADAEVVLIGDSFVHGSSVPSKDNMAAVISSTYPNTVNLGLGGSGPLLELAVLTEYLPELQPKTVVWFYFEGNDLSDQLEEEASPLLMRYLDQPDFRQNMSAHQAALDQQVKAYAEEKVTEAMADPTKQTQPAFDWAAFIKLYNIRLMSGMVLKQITPHYDVFDRTLTQAKQRVEAAGGRMIFVYLPEHARYLPRAFRNPNLPQQRKHVMDLAHSLDLPVVDGVQLFDAYPKNPVHLFSHIDAHYSKQGYAMVAEAVVELMKEQSR